MNKIVNSESDAWIYWKNKFGDPEIFAFYNDISIIDNEIYNLENELKAIEKEIQNRNENFINQYKINEAIDLHFIIKVGYKYRKYCISGLDEIIRKLEEEQHEEYSENTNIFDNFSDSDFFTKER